MVVIIIALIFYYGFRILTFWALR